MPEINYNKEQSVKIDEELKLAVQAILEHCEQEDSHARQIQLKEAKQLDHYWNGLQHIFWDNVNKDWRIPTHDEIREVVGQDDFVYDYVVNIFLPHGESIIAALSSDLPYVQFAPHDPDDPLDIKTAKSAGDTGKFIEDSNDSKEIFLHALFTLFTGHLVACYNYYDRDDKYGIAKIPVYKKELQKTTPDTYECDCGAKLGEVNPGICPNCAAEGINIIPGTMEEISVRQPIDEEIPKGMERLEIYGLPDVKVPIYAKDQKSCGYLIKFSDLHYSYVTAIFGIKVDKSDSEDESFEKTLRTPSIGRGRSYTDTDNLVTVKQIWVRPWQYNVVDEDKVKQLKEKFPEGFCYSSVGKKFLDIRAENLDDHWTITKPRPSRTVHGVPLGAPLVSVQEIRNTLKNIAIETIERGIPLTFVDKEVLDFEKFRETDVGIGEFFPVKQRLGKNLGESFHETKSATLSKEVPDLERSLDADAQFVTGSFPSVYGGPAQSGSKTFGEYVNSRNYALQRLSIPWQYISIWWGRIIYKSILSYFNHQLEDDFFSQKNGELFRKVWIRKADTQGKFKLLIPEVDTNFPTSTSQKRALLMQLVELNNSDINSVLFSPENAPSIARLGGLPEIKFPGELQALKQLMEIEQLIKSPSILSEVLGMDGEVPDQPMEKSSIPVEEIDDHQVHYNTTVNFLISESGQSLKEANPDFYKNVMLHAVEHKQALMLTALTNPASEEQLQNA